MSNSNKRVGFGEAVEVEVFNSNGESIGVYRSSRQAVQKLRIGKNEFCGNTLIRRAIEQHKTVHSRTLNERVTVVKTK